MRRIGVIGTFVWDTIRHPSARAGEPVEQWGGVAYSLSAFSAACPPGFTIFPIARVGADLADAAFELLDSLPNVSAHSGIRVVPEANNRVELLYDGVSERKERLTGGVSAWPRDELHQALDSVDALYVNFLSGFEMDLTISESLKVLEIPIYADLHSLFLGPPAASAREPRRLPEWRRWLGCFDAVQMNENELALLGPERADPLELLPELPKLGPLLAVVTRGEAGATYATEFDLPDPFAWPALRRRLSDASLVDPVRMGSEPRVVTVATGVPPLTGDPTGCGDVWGAVLFASLCEGLPVDLAIRRAHAGAAAKMGEGRVERVSAAISAALRTGGRDAVDSAKGG
jgi:sugar/nucleoside kinase (ribokinase family)